MPSLHFTAITLHDTERGNEMSACVKKQMHNESTLLYICFSKYSTNCFAEMQSINLLRISHFTAHGWSQQRDSCRLLLGNKCTSIFNYPCFFYPAVTGCFDVSLRSHWSNLIKNWQCWKTKTRSNCPLVLPCASFL